MSKNNSERVFGVVIYTESHKDGKKARRECRLQLRVSGLRWLGTLLRSRLFATGAAVTLAAGLARLVG